MLFLYISRFDLKLYKAKELKRFFSLNKIEALREEKDNKLNDVKFEQISDTEKQPKSSGGLIDINNNNNTSDNATGDPLLPIYSTQPYISGRKRKYIENDIYQSHQFTLDLIIIH